MKTWEEHKWSLTASIEAQDGSVQLVCLDPCEVPYHGTKMCVCEWNREQPMDLHIEGIPVRVAAHEDLVTTPGYFGDDYDPGWLRLELEEKTDD